MNILSSLCSSVIDRHGCLCDYGLYHGNILDACSFGDLLVASAYKRNGVASYDTRNFPNTLIAQIELTADCDIHALATYPEFDMRVGLNAWMNHISIRNQSVPLVVIEMDQDTPIGTIMDDLALFIEILERKNKVQGINRILVPMLGTGSQRMSINVIAPAQIKAFHTILFRSNMVREICMIDIDEERARETAEAWHAALGRGSVLLVNDDLTKAVAADLLALIEKHLTPPPQNATRWMNALTQCLCEQNIMSTTLPSICRHICETVLDSLDASDTEKSQRRNTADRIESLYHQFGIAHWIVSYLHVLRQFGNYGSHESGNWTTATNPQLTPTDLTICLQCIRSVLSFWVSVPAQRKSNI